MQWLNYGLGCISVNGKKTDLYVIKNGALTALGYCNESLEQFVRPYAGAIVPEFILMEDKCPFPPCTRVNI